jgi:hypothetical protein
VPPVLSRRAAVALQEEAKEEVEEEEDGGGKGGWAITSIMDSPPTPPIIHSADEGAGQRIGPTGRFPPPSPPASVSWQHLGGSGNGGISEGGEEGGVIKRDPTQALFLSLNALNTFRSPALSRHLHTPRDPSKPKPTITVTSINPKISTSINNSDNSSTSTRARTSTDGSPIDLYSVAYWRDPTDNPSDFRGVSEGGGSDDADLYSSIYSREMEPGHSSSVGDLYVTAYGSGFNEGQFAVNDRMRAVHPSVTINFAGPPLPPSRHTSPQNRSRSVSPPHIRILSERGRGGGKKGGKALSLHPSRAAYNPYPHFGTGIKGGLASGGEEVGEGHLPSSIEAHAINNAPSYLPALPPSPPYTRSAASAPLDVPPISSEDVSLGNGNSEGGGSLGRSSSSSSSAHDRLAHPNSFCGVYKRAREDGTDRGGRINHSSEPGASLRSHNGSGHTNEGSDTVIASLEQITRPNLSSGGPSSLRVGTFRKQTN